MDRSVRSRTSSTSSVRSPAGSSTPAPTPAGHTPAPRHPHRIPSPDQLAASLSRLRAERALSNPATPAPTPNQSLPHHYHTLHPDAILASLSSLGGDEGIATGSVPGTPAPTPFSPSPSISQHIQPEHLAASIARLREEGVLSLSSTQPTTPSSTPAYPPYQPGQAPPPAHNLGIIPEHLAEGIAELDAGRDEGLDSGSNPCTPIPTPFSPSPAQHSSVLAEQLAAGIHRLKVEEGMSSGGSTGMPATPAPTPFSHGPGGVRPEDLAAGISRLSVIQEAADTATPQVAINVLEATDASVNTSNLSNYFGSPQSSGESIFDQLVTPATGAAAGKGRSRSNSGSGFQDVTISTPAKQRQQLGGTPISSAATTPASAVPPTFYTPAAGQPLTSSLSPGGPSLASTPSPGVSQEVGSNPSPSGSQPLGASTPLTAGPQGPDLSSSPAAATTPVPPSTSLQPQQLGINLVPTYVQHTTDSSMSVGLSTPAAADVLSPASSTISAYATPAAATPIVESPFPGHDQMTPTQQFVPATSLAASLPSSSSTLSAPPTTTGSSQQRPVSPAANNKSSGNQQSDAWIPTPACREVLDSMANTPGTFYPSRDQLTCPGVTPGSEQGDPVRDLVAKYQGENEACKRHTLAADGVTTDTRGLQQLIAAGNYRAAVNLTAQLLEMYGQGKGKAGQLSKHSATSLQIWFTRLGLLVKLKLFNIAETEAEHFGELDKPDLFYQYYPELYQGRRGSLASWSMRLLLAQIPALCGKHIHSLNRLFGLLFKVRDMLSNLSNGLSAEGDVWLEGGQEERSEATLCWQERERQVLYSLINASISGNDFESAIKCLDMLVPVERADRQSAVYAAYGRLYLQLGHIKRADECFAEASKLRDNSKQADKLEGLLDSAFLSIGQGQFATALERFQGGLGLVSGGKQEKVIRNNIAVCLLYLGRLKEGLQLLENSITADPTNIQGNPMLNLCTLYELESSYALQKKIGMLGLVSIHASDSFQTTSLKL